MASEAYADSELRLSEAIALVRMALAAPDPVTASGCSKGAVVLAAAALERYMNDVLREAFRRLAVETYDELAEGYQSYLVSQIAQRLNQSVGAMPTDTVLPQSKRDRFRREVAQAAEALQRPSAWSHPPTFGTFLHGAAVPERINAVLQRHDAEGRNLSAFLEANGADVAPAFHALTELIEARHSAAHALPDRPSPSPKDAQTWLVLSFRLTRNIDRFLKFRPA